MKIVPKAVENFLASPDRQYRAVLLYGPDSGLVRERTQILIKSFLGMTYDPFALVELAETKLLSDPALLADELNAISMMAPKRVIVIRDAGDKMTRIIEDAASSFNDSVFLIAASDELPGRSTLRAWFEKSTVGAAIACYKDEARDIQQLIRKTFEAASVATDRDVIDYLSQRLGNDRYVTHQELEKLVIYAGDNKRLNLEEAQMLVDYNRDTGFDELVNAVADRNLQALDTTLALLQREGLQPVGWLRAVQRYFNRLYQIRSKMDMGVSAEQVIQGLRPPVFFKQVPILTRHVQNWKTPQIVKALKLLVAAELACKTSDLPPVPASSRRLLQITQIR